MARCDDWINSWINGAIDATGVGLSLSHRVTRVLWKKSVPHSYWSLGDVLISLPKAMSPQVVIPLLSVTHGQCDARPTVTFPAARRHRPLAGTKLYCSVTEARVC